MSIEEVFPPGYRPVPVTLLGDQRHLVYPNISEHGVPHDPEFDQFRDEVSYILEREFIQWVLFMYSMMGGISPDLDTEALDAVPVDLFEWYMPAADRMDAIKYVRDAVWTFRERNRDDLEFPDSGLVVTGTPCSGKTMVSEAVRRIVSRSWTVREQDEFGLVSAGKAYMTPISQVYEQEGIPLYIGPRDVLTHEYTRTRTMGHTRLNFLYHVLARNVILPLITGAMIQHCVAVASYCHFGEYKEDGTPVRVHIPRAWKELYDLLPWKPKCHVYLDVPEGDMACRVTAIKEESDREIERERMDGVLSNRPSEYYRRSWALQHAAEMRNAYETIVSEDVFGNWARVENGNDRDPEQVARQIAEFLGPVSNFPVDEYRVRRDVDSLFPTKGHAIRL